MKKWLLLTLLIVSVNTFSQSNPVLSSPGDESGITSKILLGITHNDDAASSNLRTAINALQGAKILSYCGNHALFMITIDNNFFTDANDFLIKLQKQAPQYALLLTIKEGDFDSFKKYCEPSDDADAKRLKLSFTN